jgi:hypothetical protein
MTVELFFYENNKNMVEKKMTLLFKINTLVQREDRPSGGNKESPPKTINFQKKTEIMFFNKNPLSQWQCRSAPIKFSMKPYRG